MPNDISYKSFFWSLGTTSFRTKDFNRTIEAQLGLLDEFWRCTANEREQWSSNSLLQERYYHFMQEKNFLEGEARNKSKDAREKTSGLVDIGLIDDGRKLTNVGQTLLEISRSNDFTSDNFFLIPKDSYIYLKQLLKTSCNVSGEVVRPFIVLLYVLSKVEYLSLDEFTYLLPLCTSADNTEKIITGIIDLRNGEATIDDIIISRLMSMMNYQIALRMLCAPTNVDELLLCTVGLNRKSREYDKPYFDLYNSLRLVYPGNRVRALPYVFDAARKTKLGTEWIKYLFNTSSRKAIERNPGVHLNRTLFDNVTTEEEFRTAFFKVMHLLKAKATLHDYFDLNRRYIKTTDIILFEDSVVKMDIVPKHYFASVADELFEQAFSVSRSLEYDCSLQDISACLIIDEQAVIVSVNAELGTHVTTIDEARAVIEDNRYCKLQHLIDTKFTDENLLSLLNSFELRDDNNIRSTVTDNADVPTIFEYVLGIIWYKVSGRTGRVLDFMKLSLDADLLPKTHAAGGEADIVYEYPATEAYPAHTLLLEATLAGDTNQRRMEMEPVSRHLGQHLIRTGNLNSYCVFTTTYLDLNVVSDFRSRKTTYFYDTQDDTRFVTGMKIIPLQTSELKKIIENQVKYYDLFSTFSAAFDSELPPNAWYQNTIVSQLM